MTSPSAQTTPIGGQGSLFSGPVAPGKFDSVPEAQFSILESNFLPKTNQPHVEQTFGLPSVRILWVQCEQSLVKVFNVLDLSVEFVSFFRLEYHSMPESYVA